MKVDLYKQSGEKSGTLDLPKEIFETRYNPDLIHQALVRQHANGRRSTAHTKTKGDVNGGGAKPFRQKGTGRARQGSSRNPHMKGGGVAFGPSNVANYTKDMPKKQRRAALFSALSKKASDKQVIALEEYKAKEAKTKDFAEMLKKLPIDRNVLVVIPAQNEIIQKSSGNIRNAKTILASYLNIADLQKYEKVLILKDAVDKLKETFLNSSK